MVEFGISGPTNFQAYRSSLHNAGESWNSEGNHSCTIKCLKANKKTQIKTPATLNSVCTSFQQLTAYEAVCFSWVLSRDPKCFYYCVSCQLFQ